MKKALFVCLLSTLVLESCASSLSSSLQDDKEKFIAQDDFSVDCSAYFKSSLLVQKGESVYRLSYTLDNADKDYHHVRMLLSPKKDTFFPFGYDDEYTLVKNKNDADRKKNLIFGININFSSTIELTSLYAAFYSDEVTFYFSVNVKEGN